MAMNSITATRQYAYARLGVKEEDVSQTVQITPQLKAIAAVIRRAGQPRETKRLDGAGLIETTTHHMPPYGPGSDVLKSWPWYLESSDAADARKVLSVYYSCFKIHRSVLPIEAFCLAASVSPLRILEIITATCVRLGVQASTMVASINHPRIVEKTVEMALTDEGHLDRSDLHKAVGFLPTAKGSQTTIQVVQNAQANATAAAASAPAPPPEATIRRLVNRFNESKSLPADTGSIRVPEVMPHEDIEGQEAATLIAQNDEDDYEEEEA
jgi:hypothetical protein